MTRQEMMDLLIEDTIVNVSRIEEESLRAEKENRIPKIVHYCYLGWRYIKDGYLQRIAHWHEVLGKDWIFVNWTPLIKPIESEFERWLFDNNKRAFYADVVRAKQMTRYGGVYMDCDVELHKDLSPLLERDYIFCKEINQGYMDGGVFLAKKDNIFLKTISQRYDRTTPEEYQRNPKRFLLGEAWRRALIDAGKRFIYDNIPDFETYDKLLERKDQNNAFCIDTKWFCNPVRYYQKAMWWMKPNPDAWTTHLFTNSWNF